MMALTVFSIPVGGVYAADGEQYRIGYYASSEDNDTQWNNEFNGNIAIGETFTWAPVTDEEDSLNLLIDHLDADTVVKLSIEANCDASAYIYQVKGDKHIAETHVSKSGDMQDGVAKLEAGKAYYIEAHKDDLATEMKVSLTLNPIQDINFHFNRVFYENTGGHWVAESGKKYYEYDYEATEGDTFTIVDAEGNQDVYTCMQIDREDYDYYYGFINENGDMISDEDVVLEADQGENHWLLGSDNVLTVSYMGLTTEIKVTIEESPVANVTVTPARQYKVPEDEYDIERGLDGKDYHRYYLPYWNEGDKLTIVFKDGETRVYMLSFDKDGEDIWTPINGTEKLNTDELELDSDQQTKHWNGIVSKTNTFYAVFMGKRSNDLNAKIIGSLRKAKVTLSAASLVYTGKIRKPSVKTMKYVTSEKKTITLKKGTHYRVDYCDKAVGVGNYHIGFAGIGDYGGFKETTFKIIPKGASILKPKAKKKAITVKWKKQGSKMKYQDDNYDTKSGYITGYQVQYSLKSNFKSAKTKTVPGYKNISLKVKKLKAKKKYYVRVRTYMTVKDVGTFYSKWSAKKAVKTKK